MLKFPSLATITDDVAKIANALQESHLIELSEDKARIRRNQEIPLPENTLEYWQDIRKRTVYVVCPLLIGFRFPSFSLLMLLPSLSLERLPS